MNADKAIETIASVTETAILPVFIVTGASRGIGHAIVGYWGATEQKTGLSKF
jgi:hypothetical protein